MKNKLNIFIFVFSVFILIFIMFNWTDYLFNNNYIDIEGFVTKPIIIEGDGNTHTVDLPINTNYSCQNICGPPGRCYITGEDCVSDIDCYGCKPKTMPPKPKQKMTINRNINDPKKGITSTTEESDETLESTQNNPETMTPAYDGAGKLTMGVTPTYSILTTDMSNQANYIDKNAQTPQYNTGYDTWSYDFNLGQSLHMQKYYPSGNLVNMPKYPERPTLTGMFLDNGPYGSNAEI